MRYVVLISSLLALIPMLPARAAPPPATAQTTELLPPLVASLLPSVVNITILKQRPGPNGMAQGATEMENAPVKEIGSGFIIDSDGYVLTARHVVEGAYQVTVVLSDHLGYPAEVLSTNARPDLALLRIHAGRPLQAVRVGDSDALRMGETVIAVGNPYGLSDTVTVGVVSALNRDINETSIDDFIQTDAAVNHGNSGGPLFNLAGEVVGLNAQILTPSDTAGSIGLSLAIPINDAMAVSREMRQYGRLRAGYLGLRLEQLTPEVAGVAGLTDTSGGIVSAVDMTGPAARAGLREGDIVLQFGDRHTIDIRALLREIGITPPGTVRAIRIWRDRAEQTVEVTLGAWGPNGTGDTGDPAGNDVMPTRGQRMSGPTLGLRVTDLTPDVCKEFQLPETMKGVIVLGVPANSVGADVGFARGDVVTRVGDDAVRSQDQIQALVRAARARGEAKLLMLTVTKGRPHWLAVPTSQS